ncbi:hypothetical protein FQZ97_679600 [compost metagenome]
MARRSLDSGKLDPRALIAQSETSRDAFGTQAKQVRDQWLAVWDSLNDTQRGQVTQMLKDREAKRQDRMAKMEARHGKGRGPAEAAPSAAPAAK